MLTDTDLRRFRIRALRLAFWGFLLLSVALNVFLLIPKPTGILPSEEENESASVAPGRWAFGVVKLMIAHTQQKAPGTGSVLPVSSYTIPDGMIPTLPDEMSLYRDTGVVLGDEMLTELWATLGIPIDRTAFTLHPTTLSWISADGLFSVSFDVASRTLRVRDQRSAEPADTPADDQLSIDLAKDFMKRLGIELPTQDTPLLISMNGGETWVHWPKRWKGMPMIDAMGNTVYEFSVQIDREVRKATVISINLFAPETLTASDYPTAGKAELQPFFLSGGLTPLPTQPAKKAETVSFTSMEKVYVLLQGDNDTPTYAVPAIRAYWISKQTCDDCAPILFSTFVPALSTEQFEWRWEKIGG